MDGEWIELDSPSASADGELWSRHREARGVSPADGIAAMASSFAAQFIALGRLKGPSLVLVIE